METFSLNGTLLKPLPLKYAYDSDVKIKSFNEYFTSGVVFSFTPVLENPRDLTTNNYVNMVLSDKMDVSTFVSLSSTAPSFPNYIQTQIRNSDNEFWAVGGGENDKLIVRSYPDGIVGFGDEWQCNFEIILLNHIDCVVRTYIDKKLKYLDIKTRLYSSFLSINKLFLYIFAC